MPFEKSSRGLGSLMLAPRLLPADTSLNCPFSGFWSTTFRVALDLDFDCELFYSEKSGSSL